MKRLDLNQTELAKRLQVSQGTVSAWVNRSGEPQPRTAAALAALLGVRKEWLMLGQEPRLPLARPISSESVPIVNEEDHPPYGTAETLRSEIRRFVEDAITLAGDDVGKLGWLREQIIRSANPPEHWDVIAQVIADHAAAEDRKDAVAIAAALARLRGYSARAHGKAS